MKDDVRNAEQEENGEIGAAVARKAYWKPRLTVYEDLRRVTGQPPNGSNF